jgi:hypothetical protein
MRAGQRGNLIFEPRRLPLGTTPSASHRDGALRLAPQLPRRALLDDLDVEPPQVIRHASLVQAELARSITVTTSVGALLKAAMVALVMDLKFCVSAIG